MFSRRRFLSVLAAFTLSSSLSAAPAADLTQTHASVRAVIALQNEITRDLMQLDSILGTAVGFDERQGRPSLLIFVDRDSAQAAAAIRAIPAQLRGIPVTVEVTEKFRALNKGKGGGGSTSPTVDHRGKQTPPIKLGTSGGWGYDLANGYCCGGTLGSLIQITGSESNDGQYILSNYHVLEADIVNGGNGIVAATGDAVIQPGLIDVGCKGAESQVVATLVKLSTLRADGHDNVDAAVAKVVVDGEDEMVDSTGAILGIGTISSQTRGPALNLAVKKSGRTTGLTRSRITGLNATVRVQYDNECAGTAAFVITFTGQLVVDNKGSKFLAGGDSGSLMVEDVDTNPRAVGLLYAGSATSGIANPIAEVLSVIGSKLGGTATMVGQ